MINVSERYFQLKRRPTNHVWSPYSRSDDCIELKYIVFYYLPKVSSEWGPYCVCTGSAEEIRTILWYWTKETKLGLILTRGHDISQYSTAHLSMFIPWWCSRGTAIHNAEMVSSHHYIHCNMTYFKSSSYATS